MSFDPSYQPSYEEIHQVLKQKYRSLLSNSLENALTRSDDIKHAVERDKQPLETLVDPTLLKVMEMTDDIVSEDLKAQVLMIVGAYQMPIIQNMIEQHVDLVFSAMAEYISEHVHRQQPFA